MSNELSYTYTVLRYVHDVMTGEFVNVGLVVHSPAANFFRVETRSSNWITIT